MAVTFVLNVFTYLPHVILFSIHKNRLIIIEDMNHGFKLMEKKYDLKPIWKLIFLLSSSHHFRNIFYLRTRPYSVILSYFYPPMPDLIIDSNKIGKGFVIIHGNSTLIGPEEIGENCVIYQQVTIGGTFQGAPILKDNVVVYAGAVIVGKITIGNNVVIGANATVYKDVPDNCTIIAGSSRAIKWRTNR